MTYLSACQVNKKIPEQVSAPQDTVLLVSIERTPCFGRCPVYKLVIYQNGYALRYGRANVSFTGWSEARLSAQQLEEIYQYVQEHKIYDLEEEYVLLRIVDYPTTITEINIQGRYKRIVNTHPSAPEPLLRWEKFLDSFLNDTIRWKPIAAPVNSDK
jgi:hypothetical protein